LVLAHLFRLFQPKSVLDIGCGRGTWLKACGELGVKTLVGLDGPWNKTEQMVDPKISFKAVDFDTPFLPNGRFDLAMSLEVAEHLKPESASIIINALTQTSDVILFGAAVKGQGGTGHINEQSQSYWGNLFLERNYAVIDILRPTLWNNSHIEFHYRQNAFLYVKRGHSLLDLLRSQGILEMRDLGFMDCLHPELYNRYRSGERAFANHAPIFMKLVQLIPQRMYLSLRGVARQFIFK
jgi:SAM-dependent methyltransferase